MGAAPVREVAVDEVRRAVARLCREAASDLPEDVVRALEAAARREVSPVGREILAEIGENARIAAEERVPLCQDTGFAVVFIDLGQDVHLVGGGLHEAVNRGVAEGYTEGYLRKSILAHPWLGGNTGDNTPAVIHVDLVPGDRVRIRLLPKGGGSENRSALAMLRPADGLEGARAFVLETVRRAGPDACPPLVVGVGIGGTFDHVAHLAKRAILRPLGEHHPRPEVAELERQLLEEIGRLGIGPMGLGGRVTALWVAVEIFPRHIASFPVAVNIQCHAARRREAVI